jgi:eukaryotic-like serine/threonine-protein kinase
MHLLMTPIVMLLSAWLGVIASELVIVAPIDCQVAQRDDTNHAWITLRVVAPPGSLTIRARATPVDTARRGVAQEWSAVSDLLLADGTASGRYRVAAGGWYRLDVQALDGAEAVLASGSVARIGVGEVFLVAGQSNSANFGAKLSARDDRAVMLGWTDNEKRNGTANDARLVASWHLPHPWLPLADPVRPANGGGGGPWSPFADLLCASTGVPVAIIPVGIGGTQILSWVKGQPNSGYDRLLQAAHFAGAFRAVLWHQGESDAADAWHTPADAYAERLTAIIDALAVDTGAPHPWLVARAAWLATSQEANIAAVRRGQQAVIDARADVFSGPDTDTHTGKAWRLDGSHFNADGLAWHAGEWHAAVMAAFPELGRHADQ